MPPVCLCAAARDSLIGIQGGYICVHNNGQSHVLCDRCVSGYRCPLHPRSRIIRAGWIKALCRLCPEGCVLDAGEDLVDHQCHRRQFLFLDASISAMDILNACDFNTHFVMMTGDPVGPILDGRTGYHLSALSLCRTGQHAYTVSLRMTQTVAWGKTGRVSFDRFGIIWPGASRVQLWPVIHVSDDLVLDSRPFEISRQETVRLSTCISDTDDFGIPAGVITAVSNNLCARSRWPWLCKEGLKGPRDETVRTTSPDTLRRYASTFQPHVFGRCIAINERPSFSVPPGSPDDVICWRCGTLATRSTFFSVGCGAGGFL